MKIVLFIIITILILLVIAIFTKVTIALTYIRKNGDDRLNIKIKALFGMVKRNINVPVIKLNDESATIKTEQKVKGNYKSKQIEESYSIDDFLRQLDKMKEIVSEVVDMKEIIRHFLKKVAVKEFRWHSLIGTGDALTTGTTTGLAWSLKRIIISALGEVFHYDNKPEIEIIPNFQHSVAETNLLCVFKFRISSGLVAGIKMLSKWNNNENSSEQIKRSKKVSYT